MTRSIDFESAVRAGRRARASTLVVHLSARTSGVDESAIGRHPIVGLVVGKSVGNSVVRHRVSRRLRAQLAPRLSVLPANSAVVVRALPRSATASSSELGADLDRALVRTSR